MFFFFSFFFFFSVFFLFSLFLFRSRFLLGSFLWGLCWGRCPPSPSAPCGLWGLCWGRFSGVLVGFLRGFGLLLVALVLAFGSVAPVGSVFGVGPGVCFWVRLFGPRLLGLALGSGSLGLALWSFFGVLLLGLALWSFFGVLLFGPSFGSGSLVLGFLAGPLVLVWLRFLAPGFLAGPLGLVWLRFLAPGFWFGPLVLVGSGFGAGFWFGPRVWFGAGLLVGSGSFGWLRLFWFLGVFFPRCLVFAGGWFLVFFF